MLDRAVERMFGLRSIGVVVRGSLGHFVCWLIENKKIGFVSKEKMRFV